MARTPQTRESISVAMRFFILRRDKYTCRYCGAKAPDAALHVDHVLAAVHGGTNDPDNLVAACVRCNLGKDTLPAVAEPDGEMVAAYYKKFWLVQNRYLDWAARAYVSDSPYLRLLLLHWAHLADPFGWIDQVDVAESQKTTGIPEREFVALNHGLIATGYISAPSMDEHGLLSFSLPFIDAENESRPEHIKPSPLDWFGIVGFPAAQDVHG